MVTRNPHLLLDDLKRWLSQATLDSVDLTTIRTQSLSNLQRWKARGTWGPTYDEWLDLMMHATDDCIIQIMTGEGDEANRLRQSPPYIGLVDEETKLELFAKYRLALAANEGGQGVELGNDAT
jgi:hypothetical protein